MIFLQRTWQWLIAPSPLITEPDQRRQASLLSSFLLVTIVLAIAVEVVTIQLIDWGNYTGYRTTVLAVVLFLIILIINHKGHIHLAALITVIVASATLYVSGLAQPTGVLGGLFDFAILPLWLASIYLSIRSLTVLIVIVLAAVLLFPWLNPLASFNQIVVGPFIFLAATSVLLIVFTQHRNNLERDRRKELIEQEARSRREAARSKALLRVAERLNSQLDLETLLKTICGEVTLALNTPTSLLALYEPKHKVLFMAAGAGIEPEQIKRMASFPAELYSRRIGNYGAFHGLPDPQEFPEFPNYELFKSLNLQSMAYATMQYEGELIGSLIALSPTAGQTFHEDELLLLQGLAHQAALAIVNTRLFKDARRRLEHLQALHAIDLAIAANQDLRKILNVLLKQITSQLEVDAAIILLMDDTRQQLEYGASFGFHSPTLRFTRLRLGEGIAGRAAQHSRIVHVPNLQTDPQTLAHSPSLAQEGFISYFAAPLVALGKVNGVLEVFHRSSLDPDTEWLSFLEALASQAAIAIENTTLFDDLQRTNAELSAAYDSTIEGWSHALDLRDRETEGHTRRVTELTLELARGFDFCESDLVHIRRGALLHDIGKMGVPDSILLKEGKLSDQEWEVMRRHPGYAHEMLQPISYLRSALDIPYCHHEKWDGSGYPRGLKGKEIPLTARIFAVVDVWDALTSDRPYRPAWSTERTMALIRGGAGSHFDPQVVEVFAALMERKSFRQKETPLYVSN